MQVRENPTHSQHKYYRAVILPLIREHIGCESDAEAHRQVKAAFFGMHPDDPKLPSMAAMTQDEASRLIDYALRQAAEMSIVIPSPREVR